MVALVPALVLPGQSADAAANAPSIVGRSITSDATGVSILATITVRFDVHVTGVNEQSFVLRDWLGRIVPARVTYSGMTKRATLVPTDVLRPTRLYRVALSSIIRDALGNSLRSVSWSFTTGSQPSGGVRFATPRDLHFAPGTVTGIRVDGSGKIVTTKKAAVPADYWASAPARANINGNSYFLVADGIWAGYFVPTGAIIESRAQRLSSTPAPSASAVPAPTSPATPAPTDVADEPQPTSAAPTPTSAAPTPKATAVATAAPTLQPPTVATPAPTVQPPAVAPTTSGNGFLISAAELRSLPNTGPAWDALKRAADASAGSPNLSDLNQENNVLVLAKALVYARTGDVSYRNDVIAALRAAIGTESAGRTLDVGRELAAYVISADLVGLRSADPAFDTIFRAWLSGLLDRTLADGSSLTETHERRPNNWGTHAGASRAAVAAYLGDTAELARVATIFRGWTGERTAYAGFTFSELWWQSNPSQPVGINPPGATIDGRNVDGVLPEEQRRTGEFEWPAPCGNYPHGAIDGALLTAEILQRAGYPAFQWGNNAILRAEQWLQSTGCAPTGDNVWHLPLLDARYGTSYWNHAVVRPGKNFGWTDWLYGR